MNTTFDFEDGKGPVPAHQHSNGGGWVADTATVADTVYVGPGARVYGTAEVYYNAQVYGTAEVYGDARVWGNARVYDDARVWGTAQVSGDARVCGDAQVSGDARVCGDAWVMQGHLRVDVKESLFANILAQTGLVCEQDHVIAYKRVKADLSSEYDPNFKYVVGEWAVAENPDESDSSCARGLHVSRANYHPKAVDDQKCSILKCRVLLEDIITVQEGKIRCRKLFVERVAF